MKKNFLLSGMAMLMVFSSYAQNLLTNGGFENSFTDWTNLSNSGSVAAFSIETTTVSEGTKAFKVAITTLGTDAWSVETDHIAWPSVQGKEYKFSFFARAAAAGTKIRVVQQKTLYAASDFTLTNTWQKYEWVFTAQEANQQLKFHLFALGTIYMDNMSIAEVVASTGTTDALSINTTERFQTMDGFGGAIAFYDNWLTDHPNKEEIYQWLFKDLGLDWLRLKNNYRNEVNFTHISTEFVQKANLYTEDSVRVFLSSWSPPATLKSNGNTNNGTLKKENGVFVYDAFARYWKDALVAYEKLGVRPKWISIQNEPDWLTDGWETCKFTETETVDFPGYDKALDAVYAQVKTLPNVPKFIGAEPLGIGFGNFAKYIDPIKNKTQLSGYAYHLYHGGDPLQPDTYRQDMNNIKQNYSDRPNYVTEYEHFDAGWLKSAWLVNNALTEANASAYFYWDLIWPNHGLIDVDNPYDRTQWENAKGYKLNPQFYAFKHFSKHIKPGYKRVGAVDTHSAIRSSAFLSPDGNELAIILINTFGQAITSTIAPAGWVLSSSAVYQSIEGNFYQSKGSLPANLQISLPAGSLTTVVLRKGSGAVNVAPKATLTSPVNGASFIIGTAIALAATASDVDGTVDKVEFFAGSTKLGEDLTAPYSFSWTGATAGTYSLTAVATDNTGAKGTSTAIAISVTGSTTINKLPVTAITAPAANTVFSLGTSITIAATAIDTDGTIAKVEFFANGIKLGEDLAAPYSFSWINAAAGTYAITTAATDNLGGKGNSVAVSITVQPSTTTCSFGTPMPSPLPTINATYAKMYVVGSGGPNLSNVNNFTINWSLENNGLWQLSINTNNGIPNWWIDLKAVSVARFKQAQPDVTFTNSGVPGLDGAYWVTMQGANFVMVPKAGAFVIYSSNLLAPPPICAPVMTQLKVTGIEKQTDKLVSLVYPNPSQMVFNLSIAKPNLVMAMYVTDNLGRVIKTFSKQEIKTLTLLQNTWKTGIYFLHVQRASGNETLKLIRQ